MDPSPGVNKTVASVRFARLARDSAFEFLLTAVLLFGVVSTVRWVIGPSPISRGFPQIHTELVIVGVVVGLLLAGLILSPPGKASGGHVNPAISLAMWRFGVFPGAGVISYSIAQLLGSVLGVIAARKVWGPVVSDPPVVYALLQPGPGWTTWGLFIGETLGMAAIIFVVGICLSVDRLSSFVPWIVGGLVGAGIALLGTATGGSLNPARQFGPAVVAGRADFLWVYLIAPMVGAFFATQLLGCIPNGRTVPTHRLCGILRHSQNRAVTEEPHEIL